MAGLIEKPVLTSTNFARHAGISASIIASRYSGWRNALERAGLAHMYSGEPNAAFKTSHPAIYTNEELLEELRRVAELAGKTVLTKAKFAKHATITLNTYDCRFSGWQDALEQAGLGHMYCRGSEESVRLFRLRASDETPLRKLQRVAMLVDKPMLTTTDFDRHSKMAYVTLSNRFGSFGTRRCNSDVSQAQLLR
ncbi:MAG: hypothetical protein QHI38_11750 [Armatimonadota bacterium]|nr:hypothetical protein [Armatimonadota bacterium]